MASSGKRLVASESTPIKKLSVGAMYRVFVELGVETVEFDEILLRVADSVRVPGFRELTFKGPVQLLVSKSGSRILFYRITW